MIVSAQKSTPPAVKIWDFADCGCLKTYVLKELTKIQALSISANDKLLAIAGFDNHYREVIIVISLEDVHKPGKSKEPRIVARQVSDFNITALKFSAFDNNTLISIS